MLKISCVPSGEKDRGVWYCVPLLRRSMVPEPSDACQNTLVHTVALGRERDPLAVRCPHRQAVRARIGRQALQHLTGKIPDPDVVLLVPDVQGHACLVR